LSFLPSQWGLEADDGTNGADDAGGRLEASAASGQVPPAGPQWLRGLCAVDTPRSSATLSMLPPACDSPKPDGFLVIDDESHPGNKIKTRGQLRLDELIAN
jgi:hypothetical protein